MGFKLYNVYENCFKDLVIFLGSGKDNTSLYYKFQYVKSKIIYKQSIRSCKFSKYKLHKQGNILYGGNKD